MSGRRLSVLVPLLWSAAVLLALLATLRSLARTDFDGLNNFWQMPLALPWLILPTGTNHVLNAWILAGFGLLNAAILHRYLRQPTETRR